MVEWSSALATAFLPVVSYNAAVEIAKEAARTKRTVHEVARERAELTEIELDTMLDPLGMTIPTK